MKYFFTIQETNHSVDNANVVQVETKTFSKMQKNKNKNKRRDENERLLRGAYMKPIINKTKRSTAHVTTEMEVKSQVNILPNITI